MHNEIPHYVHSGWIRLSSRIHHLNHFPKEGVECYIKRDDELSCGISGSKIRKYASLMPYLKENNCTHLIIIAGPGSNNLLAALQMAREFQLKVTAFLIKPRHLKVQGNFKLSSLFLNAEEIIWIERAQWSKVELLAEEYKEQLNEPAFVLKEGASVPEAMNGAMTIAEDIVRNEKELGLQFQHLFIDAGTGFSAAALIQGLSKINHPGMVHVLLLADSEEIFHTKLKDWIGCNPSNYHCFYPQNAKSFGSVNQTVFEEIKRMAREEGVLVDPIYSAKLFYESRRYIETQKLEGGVLIVHSGGVLTLNGFEF